MQLSRSLPAAALAVQHHPSETITRPQGVTASLPSCARAASSGTCVIAGAAEGRGACLHAGDAEQVPGRSHARPELDRGPARGHTGPGHQEQAADGVPCLLALDSKSIKAVALTCAELVHMLEREASISDCAGSPVCSKLVQTD